jgi:ribosomal protein RSM22 (predicted rRNA methylase)
LAAAFDRALREAIEAESSGVAGRDLARAAEALSQRYRDAGAHVAGGHRLSDLERLAYATVRLPATAAAMDAVLAALGALTADAPATVVDLGAGPATALWSLVARWPSIARATLVDRDPDMLHLGLRLWRRAYPLGAGPEIVTCTGDLAAADVPPADLVIASYAIGELAPDAIPRAVDHALALARRAVVFVEPGTPAGFARIRAARDRLLARGAAIVAPCPHGRACPMVGSDWCHFAVRLDRSCAHRLLKHAELGWEDEKFAYVIATPAGAATVEPVSARVIRRPRKETGHVRLMLCSADGIADAVVTRRDPSYRAARHVSWGDAWPDVDPLQ